MIDDGSPISVDQRELVTGVIASSSVGIPSVLWVIKRARNKNTAYSAVAEYLYDYSALRNGVHFSSDRTGVLLMYDARVKAPRLATLILKVKLIYKCVGVRRAIRVARRDRLIRAHHPSDKRFLYVPYFGVQPSERGRGAAFELKNLLVERSNELGLPVYLETTMDQNRRVYERYGFKVFHQFKMRGSGFTTWMMRRG